MGQKSRWTLPNVVHPPTYRRFVICVPDERFYVAAFQGLLIELTYSKNWQRDSAHTAAAVSRVWQNALENVLCDDCGDVIKVLESEYEMAICEQLRFQDGVLQGYCCGEWVDIEGQEGFAPNHGDQPGDGTEQPAAGECATYHAKMPANNKWYLPTVVSDGDTIDLTNAIGAGNDGTLAPWHCPSGDTFFAGACIGGTAGFSGTDPLVTAHHLEIVMSVDGTFYRPLTGIFTVPGGVNNAEVFFQVNDSNLTDNAGSYTFDVEVCNNQPESWVSTLDYTLNSYASLRSGGYGVWAAGIGLQGESVLPLSGASLVQPLLDTDPFELTGYTMTYSVATVGGGNEGVGLYQVGAASSYFKALVTPVTGSGNIDTADGSKLAVTQMQPTLNAGLTGTNAVMSKLVIRGRGPKPSQLP